MSGQGLNRKALDYLLPYVCANLDWPHPQDTVWQEQFIGTVLSIADGVYDNDGYATASQCLDSSSSDPFACLLRPLEH